MADECQLVAETAFTVDLFDDVDDLVVCPTGSTDMQSLEEETGALIVNQTNRFSFFSIPTR